MTSKTPQRLLALSIAAGMAPLTFAQELEPVTVTASRFEQPVTRTTSPVTVITREDIENNQYTTIDEVLKSVPGITVSNSGGRGQQQSFYLRGTPNTRHSLVLIDGVRAADSTSGSTSLELLSLSQVERIEIVRGPGSALYGSEAMGGIVQIFTRDSAEASTDLSMSVGSFGYVKQALSTTMPINDSTVLNADLSYEYEDGFDVRSGVGDDDPDGYRLAHSNVRLTHQLSPGTSTRLGVKTNQGNTEFDTDFGGDETYYELFSANAGLTQAWAFGEFTADAYYTENEQVTFGNGTDRADADAFITDQYGLNFQNNATVSEQLTLIAGTDLRREDVSRSTTDYEESVRDSIGVYSGATYAGNSWVTDVSGRFHVDDQFGEAFTYSAGWKQFLTRTIDVRVSAGTAYSAPTFGQLYFPNFDNPDLNPERSSTIEAGFDFELRNVELELGVFQTDYEDLIVYDSDEQKSVNVSDAQVRGIESSVGYSTGFGLNTSVSMDYYFMDDGDGGPLTNVPEYSVKAQSRYQLGPYGLGASILVEGERVSGSDGTEDLDPYYVIDTFLNYRSNMGIRLGAKANNILDADYVTNAGYNTPGRNYLLTFGYSM